MHILSFICSDMGIFVWDRVVACEIEIYYADFVTSDVKSTTIGLIDGDYEYCVKMKGNLSMQNETRLSCHHV